MSAQTTATATTDTEETTMDLDQITAIAAARHNLDLDEADDMVATLCDQAAQVGEPIADDDQVTAENAAFLLDSIAMLVEQADADPIENELRDASQAVADARAQLADAEAVRDHAIRQARHKGMTMQAIADVTGLARQRIHQIVNHTR